MVLAASIGMYALNTTGKTDIYNCLDTFKSMLQVYTTDSSQLAADSVSSHSCGHEVKVRGTVTSRDTSQSPFLTRKSLSRGVVTSGGDVDGSRGHVRGVEGCVRKLDGELSTPGNEIYSWPRSDASNTCRRREAGDADCHTKPVSPLRIDPVARHHTPLPIDPLLSLVLRLGDTGEGRGRGREGGVFPPLPTPSSPPAQARDLAWHHFWDVTL